MAQGNAPAERSSVWWQMAVGIAATLAGLGVAEVLSALVAQNGSPLLVVGSLIIDLAPGWLKSGVIALFGTGDKAVLVTALAVSLVVGAALSGVLEYRRSPLGRLLLALGGAVGVLAALTRTGAGFIDALPSAAAAFVAILLLPVLVRMLRASRTAPGATAGGRGAPDQLTRRNFLAATGASAGIGILAIVVGQMIAAGYQAASAARNMFTLPRPAVPAPPIPAAASLPVNGITPIITPNAEFYRIDTALQIPGIDPSSWILRITGMVEHEVELTFAELLALPLEESVTTLACVSNEVGGDLIGNATWLGYPIRHLLAQAKPHSNADMVLSTSQDGWTASTPLSVLTDNRNAILAIGMNGTPLPLEHGFPVRMVVPGLYGYVSATKWVVQLDVTRFDLVTSYWTNRGWSERGPVKLSSRIDVPANGATRSAGDVVVAGVAWSQHVGISAVDVQVDEGPWNTATLAEAISVDTWRQWKWVWPATAGNHVLRVRATDTNGLVQTAVEMDVIPDGATGLDEISVTIS